MTYNKTFFIQNHSSLIKNFQKQFAVTTSIVYTFNMSHATLLQAVKDAMNVLTKDLPITYHAEWVRIDPEYVPLKPYYEPTIFGLYREVYPPPPRTKYELLIRIEHDSGHWYQTQFVEDHWMAVFTHHSGLVYECKKLIRQLMHQVKESTCLNK